jgi:hypothetical protein
MRSSVISLQKQRRFEMIDGRVEPAKPEITNSDVVVNMRTIRSSEVFVLGHE